MTNDLLHFQKKVSVLKDLKAQIFPVYESQIPLCPDSLTFLMDVGGALETADLQTAKAAGRILPPDRIFFHAQADLSQAPGDLQGTCRFVVRNKAELQMLDQVVGPGLKAGHLENMGIDLEKYPSDPGAFSQANISEFSSWIRKTDHLAIRSICLHFQDEAKPGPAVKEAFSLIKQIRSDLPCLFHAFCFKGILDPLLRGDPDLEKALIMVAALNDTSLYANFYVG